MVICVNNISIANYIARRRQVANSCNRPLKCNACAWIALCTGWASRACRTSSTLCTRRAGRARIALYTLRAGRACNTLKSLFALNSLHTLWASRANITLNTLNASWPGRPCNTSIALYARWPCWANITLNALWASWACNTLQTLLALNTLNTLWPSRAACWPLCAGRAGRANATSNSTINNNIDIWLRRNINKNIIVALNNYVCHLVHHAIRTHKEKQKDNLIFCWR